MRGGNRIFQLIRRAAMPALALIIVGTFAGAIRARGDTGWARMEESVDIPGAFSALIGAPGGDNQTTM